MMLIEGISLLLCGARDLKRLDPPPASTARNFHGHAQKARKMAYAHAGGARRSIAFAFPGDVRGALPDVGLRLRDARRSRGAVQGRDLGLSVLALRQSDRDDVR